MSGFAESGITLDFPTPTWFRFEDIGTYQGLSGFSFKEMDACWLDTTNNIFYLIELKDYTNANLQQGNSDRRISDLWKKSIDSLQMINSLLQGTAKGQQLQRDIQFSLPEGCVCKYLSIVKIQESQKAELQFINDQYKALFKSYASLFGVLNYSVLTYDSAKKYFGTFVK